jgi:hypothetical protein
VAGQISGVVAVAQDATQAVAGQVWKQAAVVVPMGEQPCHSSGQNSSQNTQRA